MQLEAQVRAAKAQAALAQNNVGYTRIVSPDNGLVGQRLVRPGQFVNIGTQVIAVVSLPGIWVIANYKKTQMDQRAPCQPATVHVDAFPDLNLTGHVDSWAPGTGSTFALLPPDNATGNFTKVVQRVPVKIVLDHHPALGTLVRPECPSKRRSIPELRRRKKRRTRQPARLASSRMPANELRSGHSLADAVERAKEQIHRISARPYIGLVGVLLGGDD